MLNPMDLTGKRILVTGASSGIGRACAILASELGAAVILVGRNQVRLDECMASLSGSGHIVVSQDLADLESIRTIFDTICHDGRKLEGFVHAAGICPSVPVQSTSIEQMRSAMTINYFAFLELVKQFSKRKVSTGGSVVAISSVSSYVGWSGGSLYCGTKGAIDSSVRALALEMVPKNIRVNSVVPSNIRTPIFESFCSLNDNEHMRQIVAKQPLGIGEPCDVAHAVAFLLSDAARFITGTQLVVDGGYLAQ
jgi:NAD(P)-dependent dehydrogenase (short-subunit alcohol dehydrogenase family)